MLFCVGEERTGAPLPMTEEGKESTWPGIVPTRMEKSAYQRRISQEKEKVEENLPLFQKKTTGKFTSLERKPYPLRKHKRKRGPPPLPTKPKSNGKERER